MPKTATKNPHPIIKILSDLNLLPEKGEDVDEKSYLRAVKSAINIIESSSKDKAGDKRSRMLREEVKRIKELSREKKEVKATEKKTTIKGDKLMGKEPKKPAPITDKSKLLPGAGFEPTDLKDDEDLDEAKIDEDGSKVDDIIKFLNGEVKDKINEIGSSVKEIEGVLVTQGDLADERDEALRQSILSDRKKQREDKLEGKDKDKGLKEKMLDSVTKPVGNFLSKLIRFLMVTFVGSVVSRLLTLLKDPAQFLDPIKQFFNFIIGFVNSVMKGLWNMTGAPINFIISGINKGVSSLLDAINKATGLLNLPPIKGPKIPLIPGPPEFQFIPLSKTAQAKNEAVQGASEGGMVADAKDISAVEGGEVTQDSGVTIEGMGTDTQLLAAAPGEQVVTEEGVKRQQEETGTQPIDFNQGPNANQPTVNTTNNITAASTGGVIGKTVQPRTPLAPKITRMSVGGIVPAPYDASNSFGFGDTYNQNVISPAPQNIMGYKKGGKVKSNISNTSNKTDSVDAKLSPGEIVMNQEQQQQMLEKTGVDPTSFVPGPQPGKVKFASGGVVTPDIPTPNKKGGGVIVLGGGKGSTKPHFAGSPQQGEDQSIKFPSTDPNNIFIPTIKSIYNIIS